jgi:hypothetical protein
MWGAGLAVCGGGSGIAALAGIAIVGFGIAGEGVVWYTALQKGTPRRMLGRTLAFADASALLPQPASYALAAATITVVAAGHVIMVAGLATLVVGLAVLAGALPEPANGR